MFSEAYTKMEWHLYERERGGQLGSLPDASSDEANNILLKVHLVTDENDKNSIWLPRWVSGSGRLFRINHSRPLFLFHFHFATERCSSAVPDCTIKYHYFHKSTIKNRNAFTRLGFEAGEGPTKTNLLKVARLTGIFASRKVNLTWV